MGLKAAKEKLAKAKGESAAADDVNTYFLAAKAGANAAAANSVASMQKNVARLEVQINNKEEEINDLEEEINDAGHKAYLDAAMKKNRQELESDRAQLKAEKEKLANAQE